MLKYSTSLESAGHPHSQNPRRSLVHPKRVVLRPPPRWSYYYEGALALDDRLGDFMYTKFIQRLVPRRSGRRRSIKEKRVEAEGWNEDLVWKLRPLLGRPLPYFIGRSPPLLQNPMQKRHESTITCDQRQYAKLWKDRESLISSHWIPKGPKLVLFFVEHPMSGVLLIVTWRMNIKKTILHISFLVQ